MSSNNIYCLSEYHKQIIDTIRDIPVEIGNHYVYCYINPLTNDPFYIGKGTGRRLMRHLRDAINGTEQYNNIKYAEIVRILDADSSPIIIKLIEEISDDSAKTIEMFLIKSIGRRSIGSGPLTNLTDGGDGLYGTKRPDSFKQRISYTSSIEHRGRPYHNPKTGEIKHFKDGEVPEGFILGNGIQNVHTKGTVFYHDPITKECIRCPEGTQPDGWISGRHKFNNHFTGKIITKHIITGETGDPTNPKPLYVDIKSKGIYTYTDLNGVRKATGASSRIISDLNFDWEYFMSAMRDPNRLITHQTRSNGLNKTHKGQHIKDVYSITFYPKESLTQEICDKILSECEWIR